MARSTSSPTNVLSCSGCVLSGCAQILKELEGLHLSAVEQLEGLYEARLALERERLKQLNAAKDDLEFSIKVRRTQDVKCAAASTAPCSRLQPASGQQSQVTALMSSLIRDEKHELV